MDLDGHALNPIARDGIALSRMDQSIPRHLPSTAGNPDAMLWRRASASTCWCRRARRARTRCAPCPTTRATVADRPAGARRRRGEPLPMSLPATLPPAPLADDPRRGDHRPAQLTFSRHPPEVDGRRALAGVPTSWSTARSSTRSRRSARAPRRRGGMDDRQRRPGRSRLPHPHQHIPGDQDQWRAAAPSRSGWTP